MHRLHAYALGRPPGIRRGRRNHPLRCSDAQNPSRPSCFGSRCQSFATLTRSDEEDLLADERLDLRRAPVAPTSCRRDPPCADDDALLAVALDEEVRVDLDEVLVVALDHVVDRDGDRVRQLVADALERGLADELGDAVLERLVGDGLGRVERSRTTGHAARCSSSTSTSSWIAARRRDRDDRLPLAQLADTASSCSATVGLRRGVRSS